MQHLYKNRIIPGIGVGDLALGDAEQTILQKFGSPIERNVMSSGIVCMNYGSLKIWLNRQQQIQQIGVYEGFQGETLDGIGIGMKKERLKQIWGFSLAYNSDYEAYEFLNHPGLLFEFTPDTFGIEHISVIYIAKI